MKATMMAAAENALLRVYTSPDEDTHFLWVKGLEHAMTLAQLESGVYGECIPKHHISEGSEIWILNLYGEWGRVVVTGPCEVLPELRQFLGVA